MVLAVELDRLGIASVYAGYWVMANDLTFVSDGHVTVLALDESETRPGRQMPG